MRYYCIPLVLAAFLASALPANGKRYRRKTMEPYRRSTFTTIFGRISAVNIQYNRFKKEKGLHLRVRTSSKQYIVHVCPRWYVRRAALRFKPGRKITVSGSGFINKNRPNIYAATIVYQGKTIRLRNPDTGRPLWRGRHKPE